MKPKKGLVDAKAVASQDEIALQKKLWRNNEKAWRKRRAY